MKLKLLHFQIATAALLAPVAVSLASPTAKSVEAKPAAAERVKTTIAATPVAPLPQVARIAPAPAPVAQAAPSCAPKVRVVYAGYVAPAPKTC